MNGLRNGGSNDIKYPANCASRLGTPGSDGEDSDKMYEPKHNKKIVRIFTVMAYVFSVSLGAILLSLYYLFIWDPYIKSTPTPRPTMNQASSPPTSASLGVTVGPNAIQTAEELLEDNATLANFASKDEPKTLALTVHAYAQQYPRLENPFTTYAKRGKFPTQRSKKSTKVGRHYYSKLSPQVGKS